MNYIINSNTSHTLFDSHTYVLSIGCEGMNHQIVLDAYVSELKTLSQCAYNTTAPRGVMFQPWLKCWPFYVIIQNVVP